MKKVHLSTQGIALDYLKPPQRHPDCRQEESTDSCSWVKQLTAQGQPAAMKAVEAEVPEVRDCFH